MKKIVDYKKLLGIESKLDLKELKTAYRNIMKEWHPDKFNDNETLKLEAEEKSKQFIEAYTFLVSIAPETTASNLPEYTKTITSTVVDYRYKAKILEVEFSDGSKYEYFDVPNTMYNKLQNAEVPSRFIRRNICQAFLYRKVGNPVAVS